MYILLGLMSWGRVFCFRYFNVNLYIIQEVELILVHVFYPSWLSPPCDAGRFRGQVWNSTSSDSCLVKVHYWQNSDLLPTTDESLCVRHDQGTSSLYSLSLWIVGSLHVQWQLLTVNDYTAVEWIKSTFTWSHSHQVIISLLSDLCVYVVEVTNGSGEGVAEQNTFSLLWHVLQK